MASPAGPPRAPRAAGGFLWHGLRRARLAWELSVLPVLLPDRCVRCGVFETALCADCGRTLLPADSECCPRCGRPDVHIGGSPRCPECFDRELAYSSARSAFRYEGAGRDLVAALKFGGRRSLAPLMSGLALPAFDRLLGGGRRVVVTWVPCHPSSSRRRGYNQAEVLARALAAGSANLRAVELVAKVRRTAGQRSLDRARRQGNLEGAFAALLQREEGRALGGQSPDGIVLVDDVYTTGATVQEVAMVLAGSTELPIRVFTFARALAPLSAGVA